MSETSFKRESRLLKPKEFKQVFDNTEWRSSSPQLLLLANSNQQGQARLGFVLAKKHIKLAVDRNRIKRIVRESFRHNQQKFEAVDYVVLGRPGIAELDNCELREMIDALWFKLKRPSHDRKATRSRPGQKSSR